MVKGLKTFTGKKDSKFSKHLQLIVNYSFLAAAFIGLYFTSWINYLLFHMLAEIFSIVVAFSIFVIAWNSKKYIRNSYLLFIGIAYLFIAALDLLHTISYKGMPVFTDYPYYANQLWIAARYMESITLLMAFFFLGKAKAPRADWVFAVYAVLTGILIASIFYWKIFPICFVDGSGLTPFKKISEYIICAILLASIFLLQKNKENFEGKVYQLLLASIICTIISELAFTYYVSNYGLSNLVGHYFKIISFFLVTQALIKTGVEKPFELIFLEFDRANKGMKQEIEVRTRVQQENEKLIEELHEAMAEIKTLTGLLPTCASCKKIRNSSGEWEQMESYIQKRSDAKFSHGICLECAKKLYPEFYDEIVQNLDVLGQ